MPKNAVMFGSIGALMETSDIQRRAYNRALSEAGLAWTWDRDTYTDLLLQAGGRERLEQLAAATAAHLTADQIEAIHLRKTEIACAEIIATRPPLRPGVVQLVQFGKSRGMKLGFITSTYQANIDAILEATDEISAADFDTIVTRLDIKHGKPAPDAYQFGLSKLSISPGDALAIEDTANSVAAAKRAGVTVVAIPGELTASQDFWLADLFLNALAESDGTLDRRVVAMLD